MRSAWYQNKDKVRQPQYLPAKLDQELEYFRVVKKNTRCHFKKAQTAKKDWVAPAGEAEMPEFKNIFPISAAPPQPAP
jgi:hypothetical protein